MIIYNKYNNTVKVVKRYEGDAEHIKNDLIDMFYSYDTGYIDHMGTISEFENYTRLIQDQQWNGNLNKDFNYDHYKNVRKAHSFRCGMDSTFGRGDRKFSK